MEIASEIAAATTKKSIRVLVYNPLWGTESDFQRPPIWILVRLQFPAASPRQLLVVFVRNIPIPHTRWTTRHHGQHQLERR